MQNYILDFFSDSHIISKKKWSLLENKKESEYIYITSKFVGFDKKHNAFYVPVVNIEKNLYKMLFVLPRYIKKIQLPDKSKCYLIKISKKYYKLYALCILFQQNINLNLFESFEKLYKLYDSINFKLIKFDEKTKIDNLIKFYYQNNKTKSGRSAVGGGGVV